MVRYYEDLEVGAEHESPARTITQTDIVVEHVTMLNQRGEVVQEGEHGLMVLRKGVA